MGLFEILQLDYLVSVVGGLIVLGEPIPFGICSRPRLVAEHVGQLVKGKRLGLDLHSLLRPFLYDRDPFQVACELSLVCECYELD